MHPVWTGPPRRAVPDLESAEPDERIPLVAPRTARAMVHFTDKTLHLCWVRAWQNRGRTWIVHLAWGDSGQVRDAWVPARSGESPRSPETSLNKAKAFTG